MTFEEIFRAALTLYRDPDLRPILADALAELPVPMTWAGFLESSGTLERLAEAMAGVVGTGRGFPSKAQDAWATGMGIKLGELVTYAGLCAAFGVPPVMCEVGVEVTREDRETIYGKSTRTLGMRREIRWFAPSYELALATLRAYLGMDILAGDAVFWNDSLGVRPISHQAVERSVRTHNPAASAYRVRLADGPWSDRRL